MCLNFNLVESLFSRFLTIKPAGDLRLPFYNNSCAFFTFQTPFTRLTSAQTSSEKHFRSFYSAKKSRHEIFTFNSIFWLVSPENTLWVRDFSLIKAKKDATVNLSYKREALKMSYLLDHKVTLTCIFSIQTIFNREY